MLIDYVIPFVDMKDLNWIKLYKKYTHKDPNNSTRFRDYGTLKYQFRGIEKNMPWIRNVYLVVQSPSQVPNWLNTNHPKVKIIYHKDIIPKEFLPTFNSSVIEMWYNRIPGISEYFIVSNDDIIPIKPLKEIQYFRNNTPVYPFKLESANTKLFKNDVWSHILFNSRKLSSNLNKHQNVISYSNPHLLLSHTISIWNEVWKKGKNQLLCGMKNSRTRKIHNHNHWLFAFFAVIAKKAILDTHDFHKGYLCLSSEESIDKLKDIVKTAEVICINDGGYKGRDIEEDLKGILDSILPDKSQFEL